VKPWNKDTANGDPRRHKHQHLEVELKDETTDVLSEDPHHTWYELKSRGRDSREGGGVECNIP
jgi:hypothetical protein